MVRTANSGTLTLRHVCARTTLRARTPQAPPPAPQAAGFGAPLDGSPESDPEHTSLQQRVDLLGTGLMISVGGLLVVSLMLVTVLWVVARPAQVYTRVTARLSRAEVGKAMDPPEWP